jgi:hypothetical protein
VRGVVLGRERIHHADPGECHPLLGAHPWQVLNGAECQGVPGSVKQSCGDEAVDIFGPDRTGP